MLVALPRSAVDSYVNHRASVEGTGLDQRPEHPLRKLPVDGGRVVDGELLVTGGGRLSRG
jgi:hypothetical protein